METDRKILDQGCQFGTDDRSPEPKELGRTPLHLLWVSVENRQTLRSQSELISITLSRKRSSRAVDGLNKARVLTKNPGASAHPRTPALSPSWQSSRTGRYPRIFLTGPNPGDTGRPGKSFANVPRRPDHLAQDFLSHAVRVGIQPGAGRAGLGRALPASLESGPVFYQSILEATSLFPDTFCRLKSPSRGNGRFGRSAISVSESSRSRVGAHLPANRK
jgi:hypothetical protein